MDSDNIYNSMQIEKDKIVGLSKKSRENSNHKNINLRGKYILPGFIDTHTHSFEGGLYSLGADLSPAKSIKDVLEIIYTSKPVGGMIFAFKFDENQIKEKRFPKINELDKVFPNLPVLLRRVDGHSCVINSYAKNIIGKLYPKINLNFSIFTKEENDFIAHFFHQNLNEEGLIEAYKNTVDIGIQNGLTSIHTMVGDANQNPLHYEWIRDNLNKFDLEFILYPQILNIKTALDLGSRRIGGCILADGSFGSHTAGLKMPYSDQDTHNGELYQSDEFWINFVKKAHNNNLQVGVHAIGDAAIEQILRAYEIAQNENPKDLRHQIIHCELISDKQIERMAKANISAVMQPMFDRLWGGENGLYHRVLGMNRTLRTTRLKSINDAKILLSGGSDFYITELNPIKGIDAAENIHNINESLQRKDAIKIFTSNAAKVSHDETRIGSLKLGLQADFLILENNPFKIPKFTDLRICSVYKKGKKILENGCKL
jgi:predicted amidohydrolase YtcJ